MALTIISEDLEKECGETVELNYFSLARAMRSYKKRNPAPVRGTTKPVLEFKDANELKEGPSDSMIFTVRPKT